MDALTNLYTAHPFWVWLSVAAILLAAEVATGSGYLLWPAASAVVVGLVVLAFHIGLPGELLLFALLTLLTTILARRYLPNPFHPKGPDINDPLARLVGHHGETARAFHDGLGRVFVDGKEWAAELDGADALRLGAKVEVIGVKGGACLRVRGV